MPEPMYPQAVLDLLETGGDRPVFEHGDRVVTATQMAGIVRRVAAGLRAASIGPADGVALILGVHPEAFAATIAAYAVGARVVGVRPGLTPGQLAHLLGQDIALVVVDASAPAVPAAHRSVDLDQLLAGPDDGRPLVAAGRPGDIARITYTSGSTGDPKGCAQTYAAFTAAWAPYPDQWPPAVRELAAGLDRYLVFGSLSSLVMMEYGVLTLAAGGTLVAADQPVLPDAIVRHRATASVVTVPRLNRLVRDQRVRPVDLGGLRVLMVSGSPLEPDQWREALEVLGPVVFQGYGQTETGLITMITPAEVLAAPATLATVGRPPEGIDVQVRDPAGGSLPPGAQGEVFVRAPSQASAYWQDPVETAEVFVDGWVRTRDLGRLDGDGYLHLLGRARDVIIVNAEIVYAGPIERALAGHPDVLEAHVVGGPDGDTGEAVHAFVVPVPGAILDPEVLRSLVEQRFGAVAVPRTVTFTEQIPTAPSGKPDKHALIHRIGPATRWVAGG